MRLLGGVFLLAAAVTAVLSLDATVVLLTPVVIGGAVAMGTSSRPGAYACLRMANSASLLLPVSNLTNLLAMPHLDLTFGGFAAGDGAGARGRPGRGVRRAAAALPPATSSRATGPRPVDAGPGRARGCPLVAVLVMLVGFAALSPFGVEPFWVSGAGRAWCWSPGPGTGGSSRCATPCTPRTRRSRSSCSAWASWSPPCRPASWATRWRRCCRTARRTPRCCSIAVVATVLANLLTNLSATLLVVPLLAPLGTPAILAALLGLNIGSGLSYTGSLANLLWRRSLARHGEHPDMREFHRVSLVATPLALVTAVTALALVT